MYIYYTPIDFTKYRTVLTPIVLYSDWSYGFHIKDQNI